MFRNTTSEIGIDISSLYLITNRHQTGGRPLLKVLEEALKGGLRLIQLREKDLMCRDLFDLAIKTKELTDQYGAKLLINDRIDIAQAAGADGVHLPSNSFPIREAGRLLGSGKLIGKSTHSIDEAVKAEEEGANFITFSPIFHTPSKAAFGEPQGVEKLKKLCRQVNIPVFALGGIQANKISEVMNAGVYGVAMISAILSAQNVKRESQKLGEAIRMSK